MKRVGDFRIVEESLQGAFVGSGHRAPGMCKEISTRNWQAIQPSDILCREHSSIRVKDLGFDVIFQFLRLVSEQPRIGVAIPLKDRDGEKLARMMLLDVVSA